ncbi:MAG: hypothetical protein GX444_15510 [Myxococcales bacterium]|nr:hypothetical protein [Myxococcales bacterium]
MNDIVTSNSLGAEPSVKKFALEEYISILRYRKWLLVIPVVTLTIVTAFASLFMSNIYRAQTTILVSGGDVSGELVPSTVTNAIEDRVRTVREQILSETLLLNVIQTYELFPEMANGPTEDRIGRMRSNIKITVNGKDMFAISYTGDDPLTVQNVTNRLAQMFISETYGDRQKAATATAEFLAQQLNEIKEQLDKQEQKVAAFKREHIGALPEQMEANQRTLDRLQAQLQSLGEQMAAAEDRKVLLETQMAQVQGQLMAAGSGQIVTMQDQLEQLQAQLTQMEQTLTAEHPDVKELKSKIAKLKSDIGSDQTVDGKQYHVNSVNRMMFERLQQTTLEIRSMEKQRGSIMGQVAELTNRVSGSPAVEQELSVLERDLTKLRETYQDLQKKHMEAKQSEELESQQKGRQFKIIDEARFPEKPYSPNRPRLVALSFTLGLIIGLIAIFVAEHLDHSFRDDDDLSRFANQSVLATIPRFTLEADQIRRAGIIKIVLAVAAALGFLLTLFLILKIGFGFNPFALLKK